MLRLDRKQLGSLCLGEGTLLRVSTHSSERWLQQIKLLVSLNQSNIDSWYLVGLDFTILNLDAFVQQNLGIHLRLAIVSKSVMGYCLEIGTLWEVFLSHDRPGRSRVFGQLLQLGIGVLGLILLITSWGSPVVVKWYASRG